MRRSELLQGLREMKFATVVGRWKRHDLSRVEAAEVLGVTERTFRRWCRRFEEEGIAGLADRRLGKRSPKRVPAGWSERLEELYRERYNGFTAKHFHEHLVKDHGFTDSYTWAKSVLHQRQLVPLAPRRGAHRKKRPRRPLVGMMLHQDGSRHAWIPGLDETQDLIVTMDDATSEIYSARRGGGHDEQLRRPARGDRQTRSLLLLLHRPRQPLLRDAGRRRQGRQGQSDASRPRRGAARHRAHRGLLAGSARPLGADVRDAARPFAEGDASRRRRGDGGGGTVSSRGLSAAAQCALRLPAGREGVGP